VTEWYYWKLETSIHEGICTSVHYCTAHCHTQKPKQTIRAKSLENS